MKTGQFLVGGGSWFGGATAYGQQYRAEVWESAQHPGYYHYAACCLDEEALCVSTKKPIKADYLSAAITSLLSREFGLCVADFIWQGIDPEKLPTVKELGRR